VSRGLVFRSATVSFFLSAVAGAVPALGQQTDSDGGQAAKAAFDLLEAISTRDSAALRRLMLPEAVTIALVERDGVITPRVRTTEEVVSGIGGGTDRLLERGWDPRVDVRGGLATVWLPYDFYVNGSFSHCGVDSFQFVRTSEGWLLASIVYTIEEPPVCDRHPDGPPPGS